MDGKFWGWARGAAFVWLSVGIGTACSTEATHRVPSSEMPVEHEAMVGAVPAQSCDAAKGFSADVDDKQAAAIDATMDPRYHRMQHALWHATRAGFSESEEAQVLHAYGSSWASGTGPNEEHPFCPPPQADSDDANYNPAGEDFLYMHREMIGQVRDTLINTSLPCIQGWDHVPTPQEEPLPPNSDLSGAKSAAALKQLQAWDSRFRDTTPVTGWLATHSLSQVGFALEITVHNNLHMRYATDNPPAGFEGVAQTGGAPIPLDGGFPAGWQYDSPKYDWLADPYGAAVNRTFWKIHGYVDHIIDLWLGVHGKKSIAVSCAPGDSTCYQWKGMWTGQMPTLAATKYPGASQSDGPRTASRPDARTVAFNQKRMRHQFLGVLTQEKLRAKTAVKGPGKPSEDEDSDPNDPYNAAVKEVCASPSS